MLEFLTQAQERNKHEQEIWILVSGQLSAARRGVWGGGAMKTQPCGNVGASGVGWIDCELVPVQVGLPVGLFSLN